MDQLETNYLVFLTFIEVVRRSSVWDLFLVRLMCCKTQVWPSLFLLRVPVSHVPLFCLCFLILGSFVVSESPCHG